MSACTAGFAWCREERALPPLSDGTASGHTHRGAAIELTAGSDRVTVRLVSDPAFADRDDDDPDVWIEVAVTVATLPGLPDEELWTLAAGVEAQALAAALVGLAPAATAVEA